MRHHTQLLLSTALFALSGAGLGALLLILPADPPDRQTPLQHEANSTSATPLEKPEGTEAARHARRFADAFQMPYFSFGSLLPRRTP